MFDPTAKSTKNLIEKYKALYELAIKQQGDARLTLDQVKAIGKRVLNDCEELIRQECPDITFDTPLKFDENGFSEKE